MIYKTERLSLKVLEEQKHALWQMAEADGESIAVVVRRLINAEILRRGLPIKWQYDKKEDL